MVQVNHHLPADVSQGWWFLVTWICQICPVVTPRTSHISVSIQCWNSTVRCSWPHSTRWPNPIPSIPSTYNTSHLSQGWVKTPEGLGNGGAVDGEVAQQVDHHAQGETQSAKLATRKIKMRCILYEGQVQVKVQLEVEEEVDPPVEQLCHVSELQLPRQAARGALHRSRPIGRGNLWTIFKRFWCEISHSRESTCPARSVLTR